MKCYSHSLAITVHVITMIESNNSTHGGIKRAFYFLKKTQNFQLYRIQPPQFMHVKLPAAVKQKHP